MKEKVLIFKQGAEIKLVKLSAFHSLTSQNITSMLSNYIFIGMYENFTCKNKEECLR